MFVVHDRLTPSGFLGVFFPDLLLISRSMLVCLQFKGAPLDYLENLFNPGGRKRRKHDGFLEQPCRHHDHHDDDDHRRKFPDHDFQVYRSNPGMSSLGVVCIHWSTPLVSGAKFCHQCGKSMVADTNCASCGSQLLNGAAFCPHCGYKNVWGAPAQVSNYPVKYIKRESIDQ